MPGISVLFADVVDGRSINTRHSLADILLIAFAAVLCGVDNCSDMALFARAKADLLSRLVCVKHGTPSHDTFSRVFRLLDPADFEQAFTRFMALFAKTLAQTCPPPGPAGSVIAIDGKSLRGATNAAYPSTPLQLVTAWATEQRLVLCQQAATHQGEAGTARQVIALLDLAGCIVTADALHGNQHTAAAIRAKGGNYALVIKGNRGPLHAAAKALFAEPDPRQAARTSQTAHGRHEERTAWIKPVPGWAERFGFADLAAMVRVDSLRQGGRGEQRQTRYVAFSCMLPPEEALRVVREHWSIENRQHWMLDVVWREDLAYTRNDNTARNLALLRRLALNLHRKDHKKTSLRGKTKLAGWDNTYLIERLIDMQ